MPSAGTAGILDSGEECPGLSAGFLRSQAAAFRNRESSCKSSHRVKSPLKGWRVNSLHFR